MTEFKTNSNGKILYFFKQKKFRTIMLPVTIILSVAVALTVALLLMKPATTATKVNPELSVEYTDVSLGESIPLTVKATGGNSVNCFTLTFGGNGAGLSEEYIFENEQTVITDTNGVQIVLNREIGGDGAVNYWFNLANGQEIEFVLNCVSGVFVTTVFDEQEYLEQASADETVGETEVQDIKQADLDAKLANLTEATLDIVAGCGSDLALAKDNTASNEKLNLHWANAEEDPYGISLLSADLEEVIASGAVNDTINWTYTYDGYKTYTLTISGTGAMPDYASWGTPWNSYISKITSIVIEDGITRIGNNAFGNASSATSLSIGADVSSIGTNAFAKCAFKSLVIPGNVKHINSWTFACPSLETIVFEEGVQTIGANSFSGSKLTSIVIPSTVTNIASNFCDSLKTVTIAEENPTYFVYDNGIYKYNSDGTTATFCKYIADDRTEFTIPATANGYNVTTIGSYSFYNTINLRKLTIPSTITTPITAGNVFYYSSIREITFEEGVKINSVWCFDNCSSLSKINLFDDTVRTNWFLFNGCSSLREMYIPASVTSINQTSLSTFTANLSTVYYNATKANTTTQNAVNRKYDLTVGEKVDVLNSSFKNVLLNAQSVKFVGENQITITDAPFSAMPEPLKSLTGTVWVDAQGIVYKYDATTSTASVAYVPFDITTATIPATITPEDGITCTVNAVDTYAFKLAENITSVTFENPQVIETIDTYGFSYASKLASINGHTTIEEAQTSFINENLSVGYRAFLYTALGSKTGVNVGYDYTDGLKELTVVSEEFEPLHISIYDENGDMWTADGDTGKYNVLTGQLVSVNMSVGNSDAQTDRIYRVYFELSELDATMSISPGESITMNGTQMTCYATDAPNIVYVEFVPIIGTTVSLSTEFTYPSPSSDGGNLKVWGMSLSEEESKNSAGKVIEYTTVKNDDGTASYIDALHIQWYTQPDEFTVTKTSKGNANIAIASDGNGNFKPGEDIAYTVKFERITTDTSAYGKDYVKEVEFYDYIDFGENSKNIVWNEEVIEAIKNDTLRYSSGVLYLGDTAIASLYSSGSGVTFSDQSLRYDEEKGVYLYWKAKNTSTAEIATNTMRVTVCASAISIDSSLADAPLNTLYPFVNNVEAVAHYTHSEDQISTSSATKYFKVASGDIHLAKNYSASSAYFGSDIMYTIRVYNSGSLAFKGVADNIYTVKDTMKQYTYITPDNMEYMFEDEFGKHLSVTITDALIYPRTAVTSQDNKTAYITGSNSDVEYTTETLVISYNNEENKIQVLREDGTIVLVTDSLQATLDSIGYSVGYSTKFTPVWKLNDTGELCEFPAGQNNYYYIYANYKDTFMMLQGDYNYCYPTQEEISVPNKIELYRSGSKNSLKATSATSKMKREAFLDKSGSYNGSGSFIELEDYEPKLNDIIDYILEFKHYGNGEYENMPLVDDIYGTQVLLVPVDKNPQLADLGLETISAIQNKERVQLYKLSKVGVYNDVVVGINESGEYMTADTITVVKDSTETEVTAEGNTYTYSGLHTSIEWYFAELPAESYYFTVKYSVLFDPELLDSAVITAGNIVWMNNQTKHRLYDTFWGYSVTIDSDKFIVTKNDDGTYTQDDDDYTSINSGESVTYELEIYNPNNVYFTVNNEYFFDKLPNTGNIFDWEKDVNVSITWEETENATVNNLDDWYIEKESDNTDGVSYIKWGEDTSITIKPSKKFRIYVTLEYPTDTEDSTKWADYFKYVSGGMLENSFVVYGEYSSVHHGLNIPASAVLQKGVYATYCFNNLSSTTNNIFTEIPSRIYYNNQDCIGRAVSYYVVLFNDGYTRLYLNDIYDELPKGFSYSRLINSTAVPKAANTSITTTANTNPFTTVTLSDESDANVNYVSAGVTATATDNGVSFSISDGTGTNAVKYDKDRKMYYLEHNDAIVFGYVCAIDTTDKTEDVALNTVGMEYYDYNGAGIKAVEDGEVEILAKTTTVYTDQNDGTKLLEYSRDIKNIYSFVDDSTDDSQWLISKVSVERGGIDPGVIKYTDSYTNSGSTTAIPYATSVSPYATINWRARLYNSGMRSITNYTFVDTLPAPYSLTGTVAMNIYESGGTLIGSKNLFTVSTRDDDYVTVSGHTNIEYRIPLDGTLTKVVATGGINIQVSILRDENGQETITIVLSDKWFSIPEYGGYVDITLSSDNTTGNFENTVYTNFCYLIPNEQKFDSASQGSIVYKDGEAYGVMNTSIVNVSTGYSTTSVKSVEEVENSDNKTNSDNDKKYIILDDKTSEFKYTLTVTNDTNFPMTKLILIDNLPQIGDHSTFNVDALRNSEFNVSLAENPEFKVTVYPEEGDSYELPTDCYTIGYSAETEFDNSDWDGTSTWQEWTSSAENVRSLRLHINDTTATQIPARARVEFSFNAVADDENITPGMVAWNSFGYHYGLKGIAYELEAMPLAVGVKVPDVPTLQKKLVDLVGNTSTAENEETFTYLIYQGNAVEYSSVSELKSTLDENGTKYVETQLTVKQGESSSEKRKLELDNWEWETGETYNIVEISKHDDYKFGNWNNTATNSYSFVYEPDTTITLTCTNVWQKWSFNVLKSDGTDNTKLLSDAVFAIYSPEPSDSITDSDYEQLSFKPEKTYTDESGALWYLCNVAVTDSNGQCSFQELNKASYYLVEVKAPDGYILDAEPKLVTNKSHGTDISVANYTMTELPFTGGTGTSYIIGFILFSSSLFALVFVIRKRKYSSNIGE